jgi:hypothetical protein
VPGVNDRTHGLPDGDMPARAARDHARELLEGRLLEEAREQLAKQVEKIDLDDGSEAAKACWPRIASAPGATRCSCSSRGGCDHELR